MNHLVTAEKDFGENVLPSMEARAFYREWRKLASSGVGTWSAIRDAKFTAAGKSRDGAWIMTRLRNHLAALQAERCCYCRRRLVGIAYARPIEHILPKDTYGQFTFIYRNLAVACFDCNHVKSNNNWSTWPSTRRRYPKDKNCSGFFHARLHEYNSHVRYLHLETNGASISVYAGLTPQGRHLCAELLAKSSERTLAISANPRFSAAMDKLRDQVQQIAATHDDDKLLDFMEALELSANRGNAKK
ncbi:HNH endonuclease [Alcaligenes phenolicus]|uniref:HNH endonuclease n=1 Tax=Alcaligenes phenolicus TaxID=232846 RepID=A0ABV2BJK9_9BURK